MKSMISLLSGLVFCCGLWGVSAADVYGDESEKKVPAPLRTLPHQGRVQRELGRVDTRDVKAHPVPAAAEASGALGPEAHAAGREVAFGSGGIDRETIAAEPTHVVQSGPRHEVKDPED
jgi:hypothetical protein